MIAWSSLGLENYSLSKRCFLLARPGTLQCGIDAEADRAVLLGITEIFTDGPRFRLLEQSYSFRIMVRREFRPASSEFAWAASEVAWSTVVWTVALVGSEWLGGQQGSCGLLWVCVGDRVLLRPCEGSWRGVRQLAFVVCADGAGGVAVGGGGQHDGDCPVSRRLDGYLPADVAGRIQPPPPWSPRRRSP